MRQSSGKSMIHVILKVLAVGLSIGTASAYGVSTHNRESIEDCLVSLGLAHKYPDRKILAAEDTHTVFKNMGEYEGTRDQNLHLIADFCPTWRSSKKPTGYTTRHPKVSPAERKVIIAGLRERARKRGVDEQKFVGTADCESDLYTFALGDQGRSRGIFQYLKGENGHRGKMPDSVAYNWRMAADSAAVDFAREGWKKEYDYTWKWSSKKKRMVKVWYETGNLIWYSYAWRWTCYLKHYGKTSAMAVPAADTPQWAISPSARNVASNSD